jgi:prepilin-type processing-associated H-X9-DG protein
MSMNAWLNPINVSSFGAGVARVYKKQSDITLPQPVNLWVTIDESPGSINDGWFVCDPFAYATTWVDIPASYHNKAGGISFADGHSAIRKWRDPVVIQYGSANVNGSSSANFIAAGQTPPVDLNWLQERSTSHR